MISARELLASRVGQVGHGPPAIGRARVQAFSATAGLFVVALRLGIIRYQAMAMTYTLIRRHHYAMFLSLHVRHTPNSKHECLACFNIELGIGSRLRHASGEKLYNIITALRR